MTIEEKVFQRKRMIPEAMEAFGFRKTDGGYWHEAAFLNGDFSARVFVTDKGAVSGTVIDNTDGELYAPLRAQRYNGAFVNEVRSAYETVLNGIANACCRDVFFASDQANRVADRIRETYGVSPDFPWGQSPHEHSGVFRHADSGKWFALIMHIRRGALTKDADGTMIDVMNLKIDPNGESPLGNGVYPAFHMNHKMWITVTLDDTIADEMIVSLVETSFRMTGKRGSK